MVNAKILANFTKKLASVYARQVGVKESVAVKHLNRAECYAVVEQGTPSLVTVSEVLGLTVIQVEETLTALVEPVLTELWQMCANNKLRQFYFLAERKLTTLVQTNKIG